MGRGRCCEANTSFISQRHPSMHRRASAHSAGICATQVSIGGLDKCRNFFVRGRFPQDCLQKPSDQPRVASRCLLRVMRGPPEDKIASLSLARHPDDLARRARLLGNFRHSWSSCLRRTRRRRTARSMRRRSASRSTGSRTKCCWRSRRCGSSSTRKDRANFGFRI